jgi:plasmid stabilization system protein ParE
MAGVEWSDRARISLRGIANDIAREAGRPTVADKLVDAIHAKAEAHGRAGWPCLNDQNANGAPASATA